MINQLLISNRIPNEFFITSGKGESDIAIHAGSYHLALKDAGIDKFNIMTYSSILPKNATRILKPKNIDLTYGSVMETICSVKHIQKDAYGCAGLIFGWLFDKRTGEKFGGLVCESNGEDDLMLGYELKASLGELYEGYESDYHLRDIEILINSMTPKKKYGTVLISICFVNYLIEILSKD